MQALCQKAKRRRNLLTRNRLRLCGGILSLHVAACHFGRRHELVFAVEQMVGWVERSEPHRLRQECRMTNVEGSTNIEARMSTLRHFGFDIRASFDIGYSSFVILAPCLLKATAPVGGARSARPTLLFASSTDAQSAEAHLGGSAPRPPGFSEGWLRCPMVDCTGATIRGGRETRHGPFLLPHWTSEPSLRKSRGLGQSPKLGIAEPATPQSDEPEPRSIRSRTVVYSLANPYIGNVECKSRATV
jgi:hypothetical protein